jgi:Kelch motif
MSRFELPAHDASRRLLALLGVVILTAGCAGNASLAPSPASTTGPTATATPSAAPTPSAASLAGQMTHGRSTHAATVLADGRVLVAGGYFNALPIVFADVYDPRTGAFAATGSMSVTRGFDTATRLSDGRVLFAGGDPAKWNFRGPLIASAELYDPTTGTFSPIGSLTTARNLHTATLLLDGRVLITGGSDVFEHALASAEVYDPTTGTFSPTGSMHVARGFHTATLLLDGRVLITGGDDEGWGNGHFLASAEIYDPKTGTFKPTGSMAARRSGHTATLLADGRVLIAGGYNEVNDGNTSLASAEIYSPKSGTFTSTGSMAAARTFHTATLLADGRVLVTGGAADGWGYKGPFYASAELYDPKTGKFTATGPMADTLASHTATLLSDGRVLIAGGYDGAADVATAELYDLTTGAFTLIGPGG